MRYPLPKVLLTVSPFRPCLPPQLPCVSIIHRFFSPLFSHSYELLFSHLLYFDNHLSCPGVSPFTAFKDLSTSVSPCLCGKSSLLSGLPPLVFSCLSFPHSFPVFSRACSLFCQKQGGGYTPAPEARVNSASLRYPCAFAFLPVKKSSVERNPAESPVPKRGASDFSGGSSPSESVPSSAETLPPNACTPGPARETRHSPNTAERPTMRNTPDRPRATAGRAPRTFPEQTSPDPANSPSRTRSCLFPGRCRYKSETPADAYRAAPAAPAPPCGPAKNASSPQAPECPSAAAPFLHRRFL